MVSLPFSAGNRKFWLYTSLILVFCILAFGDIVLRYPDDWELTYRKVGGLSDIDVTRIYAKNLGWPPPKNISILHGGTDHSAHNAIDNDTSTFWESSATDKGKNVTVTFDIGENVTFYGLRIYQPSEANITVYARNCTLEKWNHAWNDTLNENKGWQETEPESNIKGRYIKLVSLSSDSPQKFYEVQVNVGKWILYPSNFDLEVDKTDKKLTLKQIQPSAYLIRIYLPQNVLDNDPNILALKISVNGSEDSYTLSVWKSWNVTTPLEEINKLELADQQLRPSSTSPYRKVGRWTWRTQPVLLKLANLQVYHGISINRTRQTIEKNYSDLIDIRVTGVKGGSKKENSITGLELRELAFISEKEGRVPSGPLSPLFAPLSVYYFVLLFLIPLIMLKRRGRSRLVFLLVVGFLLRIAIAPFTSHAYDILGCKMAVRTYFEQGELSPFYEKLSLFYSWTSPPIWFFILLLFYAPYVFLRVLGMPDFRVGFQPVLAVESLFIKLPLILSDVLSAYLIYRICKRCNLDERVSRLATAVYLLNPFGIWISSVWGMFDSLAVLFMLVGLYFLLDGKIFASSLIWGFGVKWYTLGLIPCLSVVSFFRNRKKRAINRLLTSILILVIGFGIFASIMVVPHIVHGDLSYLTQVLDYRFKVGGGGEDLSSLHTFFGPVLWRVFEKAYGIKPFPNFFVYTFGSLYMVFLLMFFFHLRKSDCKSINKFRTFNSVVIGTLLLFYLTYPQLTPQCVLWVLPSLILGYFVFHQINVVPLVITSSLILPYLDTTYFIMGFPSSWDISFQTISGPLECVFGALLLSVAIEFLLKTFCPNIYAKLRELARPLSGYLSRTKLFLLFLGITFTLLLQVAIIDLTKSWILPVTVALSVILQTVILITIDEM